MNLECSNSTAQKVPYLASKCLDIGANVCEAHAVCVSDDRHHETTGRLHRYTDVNVVVLADELSMP